jgi:hypothetical protein
MGWMIDFSFSNPSQDRLFLVVVLQKEEKKLNTGQKLKRVTERGFHEK